MITDIPQDLRFAQRTMRRQRGHTAVAVLTLALGIGASTAIFSLVHAIVLRPLPFREPGQLFQMTSKRVTAGNRPFTLPDFIDYRDGNRSLAGIAAYGTWSANLTGRGEPERVQAMKISANAFDLLGVPARVGRALQTDDDRPGRQHVVVLSDVFWRRSLAADPRCIGRTLTLNGDPYTIVGVLPPEFIAPVRDADLAIPLAPDADPRRNVRTSVNFLRAIVRLRSGTSPAQAAADLNAITERLRRLYPDGNASKIGVTLTPLDEAIVGTFRGALWTLLAAVGVLLLIACVNLASLALVRATARRHEFAVRTAVGASRARLVRQLVSESLLLASLGGAAGILIALWSVPLLLKLSPQGLPRVAEIGIDIPVLAFALVITVVTGVIFGLVPAWRVTRVDLHGELKQDGRGTSGGTGRDRAQRLLVIGETALSVLLLVGALLLIRSFGRLTAVEPGFNPHGVLSVRLSLPAARYPDRAALLRFHDDVRGVLERLPGVEAAGSISVLPLSGLLSAVDFTIDGRDMPADQWPNTFYRITDAGYFHAMGIPLVTGRMFTDGDRVDTPPVALLSRKFAERYWKNASPIGAHVRIDDNEGAPRPVEIVGVVGDVKEQGLDADAVPMLYVPASQLHPDQVAQYGGSQFWLVRTRHDPAQLAGAVRNAIHQVDPEAPAANLWSMERYVGTSVATQRFHMRILGAFALVALTLAGLGLYGVVANGVTQRRRELAIRAALGAQPRDILGLVVGEGLRLSAAGVVLGLAGAFLLSGWMRSLLFGVSPTDPASYALIAPLQMAVALLASWLPARRVARLGQVAGADADLPRGGGGPPSWKRTRRQFTWEG